MSSNGVHVGLSFIVSHSALSSPPIWERRAAELLRGSHRVAASASGFFPARLSLSQRASPNTGNFQVPTLRAHLSRHHSFVHVIDPCVSGMDSFNVRCTFIDKW